MKNVCGENADAEPKAAPAGDPSYDNPDLVPANLAWLDPDSVRTAIQGLHEYEMQKPNEILGHYIDYTAEEAVVVLDQSVSRDPILLARVFADVTRVTNVDLPVTFAVSCNSVPDLRQLYENFLETTGARDVFSGTFSWALDPSSAQIWLQITDADMAAAERIAAENPGLVRLGIMDSDTGRTFRLSDVAPHRGGSRLDAPPNGDCSSGFAVQNGFGQRFMTTAGHCFVNGTTVTSGPQAFGIIQSRQLPDPDLELISGSTYTNRIYTSAVALDVTRAVIARVNNPGIGQGMCASGSVTGNACGAQVTSTGAFVCDGTGCTRNLMYLKHPNEAAILCQGGDSGGPAWTANGSTGVTAMGYVVAGTQTGSNFCYLGNLGTVESSYGGISILLTP